jgi:hypothetical protein
MKKYKISKSNLKEFFGWLGKKNVPNKLQTIIDNDPVLQKLKADVNKINNKYADDIEQMKKEEPEYYNMLVKAGILGKD